MKRIMALACAISFGGCSLEPQWSTWKVVHEEQADNEQIIVLRTYVGVEHIGQGQVRCDVAQVCKDERCRTRLIVSRAASRPDREQGGFKTSIHSESPRVCSERLSASPPPFEKMAKVIRGVKEHKAKALAEEDAYLRSLEDPEVLRFLDELGAKQAQSKKP